MTTQKLLSLIPMVFIIAAAITGWRNTRSDFSPSLKIFSIAWTLVLLVEVAGHVTGYFKINNLWLYNIFFLVWFLMLILSFRSEISRPAVGKTAIAFLILLPLLFFVNVFFLQGNSNLQSLFFVTGGCFIIFLSLFYLKELYGSEETETIQSYPFFWFSVGLLIYFSVNVLYFGVYNSLLTKDPGFSKFYHLYISNGIIILLNICVIKGFLCPIRSLR